MILAGLDLSIKSSGLVKFHLDKNFKVSKVDYLGFTTTKKLQSDSIQYYSEKQFNHNFDKFLWMFPLIENFLKDTDYVALEGYSYASKGQVFDIAEFIGFIKINLFKANKNLRIYPPSSNKKYATGNGRSDKISMYKAFLDYKAPYKFSIKDLPEVTDGKAGKSPTSDLIDAFFLADLLYQEILLRNGLMLLKEYPKEIIEIFNSVDSKKGINLLCRDFIRKSNA